MLDKWKMDVDTRIEGAVDSTIDSKKNSDDDEIDLLEILYALKRKILLIIATGLLVG